MTKLSKPPIATEQLAPFVNAVEQLDSTQLAWLSGYLWAQSQAHLSSTQILENLNSTEGQNNTMPTADLGPLPTRTAKSVQAQAPLITILSASQTGNAKNVAQQLCLDLQAQDFNARHISAADYKTKNLVNEQFLLIVSATQGEGDPAEEAIPFYKFLSSRKAPNLDHLQYAVLGLGDSSYEFYCQAGKDAEAALNKLGAKPLIPRVDADLDFQETANQWQNQVIDALQVIPNIKTAAPTAEENISEPQASKEPHQVPIEHQNRYNKQNPIKAQLLTRQKITARDSSKNTQHIELSIEVDDFNYQAGDSVGVFIKNDPIIVQRLLFGLMIDPETLIHLPDLPDSVEIGQALVSDLEISQNRPDFIKGYATLGQNIELLTISEDSKALRQLTDALSISALIENYPPARNHNISAQAFIDLLRPLTPRLYSIASSPLAFEDEIHLTLGVLDFDYNNQRYQGAASHYLTELLQEGDELEIFLEPAPHFKLPQDSALPIIMIGAGTGVAPFRGFMQEREALSDEGENIGPAWLIFGNQTFCNDFLYQVEWQGWQKDSLLTHIDLAWSRDQEEKIYVSHKITEKAAQIWQYLQQGAYLYVCGDASRMAKDVEQALLEAIAQYGHMDLEDADEYLNNLRQEHRYQRDVY